LYDYCMVTETNTSKCYICWQLTNETRIQISDEFGQDCTRVPKDYNETRDLSLVEIDVKRYIEENYPMPDVSYSKYNLTDETRSV